MTVHQPPSSLWALADNLLLLWKGELIYFGPVAEVVPHFAEVRSGGGVGVAVGGG